MKKQLCLALLLAALLNAPAKAALTIALDSGTPFSVPSVNDFSPNGFNMSGIKVTVTFAGGGGSNSAFWIANDAVSGQASNGGWTLSESGNTFNMLWTFVNQTGQSITDFRIDAGSFGNTVFDAQGDGSVTLATTRGRYPSASSALTGTAGSELGGSFDPFDDGDYQLTFTATYRNAVSLGAAAPVGDLWTTLDVHIGGSGLSNNGLIQFYADTDLWGEANSEVIPEPASASLLGGLGLLFAIGRWRGRKTLAKAV